MENAQKTTLNRDLAMAICIGGIDPAKCTLVECMDKFQGLKLRHLAVHTDNGGYFLLCSDPKIISQVRKTLADLDNELEATLQSAAVA